jgi:ABC-type branched-subunit amino acid transport system ATPase component/predicted MFS family arabinose efflux permease
VATAEDRPGSLAGAVLDLEADRQAEPEIFELPVDQLPGVGEERLQLRDALKVGGTYTFGTLAALTAVDNLESATLNTLSPDIRDSLGISSGAIVFISAAAGAFLIMGALPMGFLADRGRRGRVIGSATLLFASMVALSGLAVNALMLFFARLGAGIGKSNEFTAQASLMADQYPIGTRGRIGTALAMSSRVSFTLSPLLVGGIAALIGGDNGWRYAFLVLAIPVAVCAFLAFRLPEPPRGQFEKADVLGQVIEDEDPLPISIEAGFARLLQIRTLKSVIVAFSAVGFGLFTVPVLTNLFLEDEYDLGSFGRGAVSTVGGVAILVVLPFVGRHYDRLYHEDPAKALRLVGLLITPAALLTPVQFFMPNAVLFAIMSIPFTVLLSAAFTMIGPIITSIVPYRLRGIGTALGSIYLFFIGATGGAILAGLLTNAFDARVAVLVLAIPSTLVGGLFILRASSFIRNDLAMVTAEIRDELDEHERRKADPASVPALQVHGIDFAYDQVQILFDVGFEVRDGEVLALLGTNGAGKSTILRVIAGLGTPARGVVRHRGRSITFVSPEMRTRLGIRMLPGGKGVFPDLSIRENLEIAAFNQRKDRTAMKAAVDKALAIFPELAERAEQPGASLSGGQQQLLALASVLAEEPDVLIIDELSLGLAPIMVERLVTAIEALKAQGMTIIVVEQSLNVAAAIADRAVFLEKGHVRFEGAMQELVDRDDLARAVFLGAEGG